MSNQSNIMNEGLVTNDDDFIYYSNISSDYGKLYKMNYDCSGKIKLSDDINVKYINVIGHIVYYSSSSCLYSLNLLSKQHELIVQVDIHENILELNIVNNYAFYTTDSPKSSLYKMNLLTGEIRVLSNDSPMFINIFQDHIIYLSEVINEDCVHRCVCKMNFDGGNKINIINTNALYINIIDNNLYYASKENQGHLYKLDNKTGTTFKIFNHSVSNINNNQNFIYFIDNNEHGALYNLNIDTLETEVLVDCFARNIHLINDYVYYISYKGDNHILCKIRKDGTYRQVIK